RLKEHSKDSDGIWAGLVCRRMRHPSNMGSNAINTQTRLTYTMASVRQKLLSQLLSHKGGAITEYLRDLFRSYALSPSWVYSSDCAVYLGVFRYWPESFASSLVSQVHCGHLLSISSSAKGSRLSSSCMSHMHRAMTTHSGAVHYA
ncbi:unnamed protein product, partial [Rhizoctonia solani]